ISARSGDGVGLLLEEIIKLLPVGPPLYPADTLTDRPERFLAAELIREQVFLNMREEIPYAVAVSIDTWEESEKAVKIAATVHVEKEPQKKILVGRGGQMVKEIGSVAREEI